MTRERALQHQSQDLSVQSLRGLAVLLLVGSHVYGLSENEGLRAPGDTVGRYLTESLEFIRMPLFTVISGYVYALRPVRGPGAVPRLVRGKARRLLLPLLPLTAVVGGLQLLSGRGRAGLTWYDVGLGYVYGFSHLWFLQAIFLVFLLVGGLDAFEQLRTPRRLAVYIVLSAGLYVMVQVPSAAAVFSINGAIQLLPFFLVGCALARFPAQLARPAALAGAATVLALGLALDQMVVLSELEPAASVRRLILAVAGISGTICLFHARSMLSWRPLAWLGGFAFTIYLLHTVANAGAKEALSLVGVTSRPVLFGVGLCVALLAPVAFHLTLGRIDSVRLVILGERSARQPPDGPVPQGPAPQGLHLQDPEPQESSVPPRRVISTPGPGTGSAHEPR